MKCPKCKEEIDSLDYSCEELSTWGGIVKYNKSFKQLEHVQEWDNTEDYPSNKGYDIVYKCPECRGELFREEDKALRFLKKEGFDL